MKSVIYILSCLLLTTGCATQNKSLATGALIGATGGAMIGHQSKRRNGNLVGAAVGAGIGALIGYSAYKDKIKKKKINKKVKDLSGFAPMLNKPKVKMYWVPHQIKGRKFIERHRVWEIHSPGNWAKD